ncbi:hypothetical protein [Helicobacter sp. 23-1045]
MQKTAREKGKYEIAIWRGICGFCEILRIVLISSLRVSISERGNPKI